MGWTDPSKDGVVSFSTTRGGAGAMGNKSVLLRVTLTAEYVAEDKDWWSASCTEVRTTGAFRSDDIFKFNKVTNSWVAL